MMIRSNSPVPAIPLDVIFSRIIQQCLCEGDAWDLALGSNFVNARPICHLHTFALNKGHKGLAVNAIAPAFNVQRKDVRNALQKGDIIPRRREEHHALEEDIEQ
jgi:hypothetical protein